jgi:hypothetical protein
MGGPPVYEPPRNQYGGERFICCALIANEGKVVCYDQGTGQRACTTAAGALS